VSSFQLLKKLSEGVCAEVLLVRPRHQATDVVLEVLRPELSSDEGWTRRFLEEAQHRRALCHPNLQSRADTGRTPEGRLYVTSPEMSGESLGDALFLRGALSLDEAVRVLMPLCDALEYLHERGLSHGYLKPDSIYLEGGLPAFSPKLVDFGLAFYRGKAPLQLPKDRILVEASYLAPERVQGKRGNARSDVYGLGLLLYELVTGAPPFIGTEAAVREQHLKARLPALPPSYSALRPFLARCLAKSPEERFARISEARNALAGLAQSTTLVSSDPLPLASIPPREDALGDVLGNYKLEKLLGEGAMGRVFLARHQRLGRQVALKVLRPDLAQNPTFVQRFFQEARAANQIQHEHIVQIFDFIEEAAIPGRGTRVYCVMELLSGVDFAEALRRGGMSVRRVVGIARQVCQALQAAHDAGIVHRDVKPDNIFLAEKTDEKDYVKVLDFGVAKLKSILSQDSVNQTLEGVVVGTPTYMAPEQANSQMTDARTDVYALGVVLYKALSGRAPFQGRSFAELLVQIFQMPPPALEDHTPEGDPIPVALRALVLQCLEKAPEQRPQSMLALAEALLPFESELPPSAFVPSGPVASKQELGLRRWTRGAAVVVGFLLAVGGLVQLWPQEPSAGTRGPPRWAEPVPKRHAVEPEWVNLALVSTPSGAQVTRLDTGERLGVTPLSRKLLKSLLPLGIRYELEGHEPLEQSVLLGTDSVATATLERLGGSSGHERRDGRRTAKPVKKGISRDDVLDPFAR
jgi:serine/threonine protein kinase